MTLLAHHGLLMGSRGGPSPSGSLLDLILGHNPAIFFPLDETVGPSAKNIGSTGVDGAYSGAYVLGQTPILPGGPTTFRATSTAGKVNHPGASVPSMPLGMTIGQFLLIPPGNAGGFHNLINRDDAGIAGIARIWIFRLNGVSLEFVSLRGGITIASKPTEGVQVGKLIFFAVTYDAATGATRLFSQGIQLGAPTMLPTARNFGGGDLTSVVVGNFDQYNDAKVNDLLSYSFVIPRPLTPEQIAEIAEAANVVA